MLTTTRLALVALLALLLLAAAPMPALAQDPEPAPADADDDPAEPDPAAAADADTPDADAADADDDAPAGRRRVFRRLDENGEKQPPAVEELVGALIWITAPFLLFFVGLAWNLFLCVLAPRKTSQLALVLDANPVRSFLVGFVNVLGLLILCAVFGAEGLDVPALSILTFFLLAGLAAAGFHGMARLIGTRLSEQSGAGWSEPFALIVGWFIIAFVCLIPVIGWFLAIWWTFRGVGAAVLVLVGAAPEPGPRPRRAPTL